MLKKSIIFILLFVSVPNCYAQPSLYDFVVGGTIKTLARVFIKTSNLPKLKDKYIRMIEKMKEEKFQKHYTQFYDVYKELPPDLKEKYVFSDKATKQEVIHHIETVNKRDLMVIISKIPSEFIVNKTKYYTHKPQNQPAPQVNEMFLWRSIIQKV